MSAEPPKQNKEIEERLADFTDKVLSGKTPAERQGKDPELASLTKTVEKIKSLVDHDVPDPAIARRINTRLKKVWQQDHQPQETKASPWQKFLRMRLTFQPWLQAVGAVALLIAVLAVLFPDRLVSLPATAVHNPGLISGLVIGLAAVIIIILVVTNRK